MSGYKTNKQQIIETYYDVLKDCIDKIKSSEIIITSKHSNQSLSVGINAIHRVFEYTLLKTKQLDKAYYQAQQAYHYFIEYIEQVNQSHIVNGLNHKDAIMFVYKKAIFDIHDGNESEKTNALMNIMSHSSEQVNINDKEWRTLFIRMSKCINTVLCWNNSLYDFKFRLEISDRFFKMYLLNIERLDFTMYYLEYIHQNFPISEEKYIEVLSKMLSKSEKNKRIRSGSITDQEKNEVVFNKISVGNSIFKQKLNTLSTNEFINWLYD